MSTRSSVKLLWWITGLVILVLTLATAVLFVRADRIQDSGIVAYVVSSQAAPFLRDQPGNNGAVLTVLEYGVPVRISDSATINSLDWYFVETDDVSGWLLASLVTFDPPSSTTQD